MWEVRINRKTGERTRIWREDAAPPDEVITPVLLESIVQYGIKHGFLPKNF